MKSLYIFLTSLLGALLFFCMHRIAVFLLLILSVNTQAGLLFVNSYYQFLLWDYFTLVIALILGGWYGVWLGTYWYSIIYEDKTHGGLVHHIAFNMWPHSKTRYDWENKINAAQKKLETDILELEDLAVDMPAPSAIKPIKRRVVRKRRVQKTVTE